MSKNKTAGIVPYCIEGGEILLFLQRRTEDAPHNPGNYALFGGALRPGESTNEALIRESKEELGWVPEEYELLGEFEESVSVVSLFFTRVEKSFESSVTVLEGQYGSFIPEREIEGHPLILPEHKKILQVLVKHLRT